MRLNPIARPRAYRGAIVAVALLAILAAALVAYGGRDAQAIAAAAPGTSHGQASAGNWNFEAGTLQGWHTRSHGSGAWYVYSDGTVPPNPAETDPDVPFAVPAPPEGRFAAVTDMTAPGSRIVYRDVRLDGRRNLKFSLFYTSAGPLASPDSLAFDGCEPNQQFRVDIMKAEAAGGSTAAEDVLATVFRTAPGDPDTIAPRTVQFDLSEYAGERVRLRFAQVDNRGPMRAGIDDIRLEPTGS
ncbi:MAG: hypothetical protein QOG42_986 [Solirubrobacteraceae bacterium]|nr:hypothetical protein [Solirubrobacteraceae bacterium]